MVRSLTTRLSGAALIGATCACGQLTGLNDLYLSSDDAAAASDLDGGVTPLPPSEDAAAVPGDSTAPSSDAGPPPPVDAAASDAPASTVDASPGADSGGSPPPACVATAGPELVKLAQFCIDATEVTNDQYAAFLASSPPVSLAPSPACAYKSSFAPSSTIPSGKGSNPVVFVDWCDAYAFCAWAGKHLCGAIAGGPSSKANAANVSVDEWYVACSTNGADVYPYGGNVYIQGKCNDYESKSGGTRPVGSFTGCVGGYPGISDMNGNAYEWEDACDVSVGASDSCVIRGGSWNFSGAGYGGCNTYFNDYVVKRSDTYNDTGFRCCDR